jgi:hypothetical protein
MPHLVFTEPEENSIVWVGTKEEFQSEEEELRAGVLENSNAHAISSYAYYFLMSKELEEKNYNGILLFDQLTSNLVFYDTVMVSEFEEFLPSFPEIQLEECSFFTTKLVLSPYEEDIFTLKAMFSRSQEVGFISSYVRGSRVKVSTVKATDHLELLAKFSIGEDEEIE